MEYKLSCEEYSESVIYNCFYWYTGKYPIEINKTDNHWIIQIEIKLDTDPQTISALQNKIKQDLIDFKLREIINKETGVVRELLIAKAFAFE